jgi:hypothetical protein
VNQLRPPKEWQNSLSDRSTAPFAEFTAKVPPLGKRCPGLASVPSECRGPGMCDFLEYKRNSHLLRVWREGVRIYCSAIILLRRVVGPSLGRIMSLEMEMQAILPHKGR